MQKIHNPKIQTANKWRKRYKCKRNKGDHTFELYHARRITWTKEERDLRFYRCTACGKEKMESGDIW